MSATQEGEFVFLKGFPKDVVAVSARGHISRANYENQLIPHIRETVKSQGKAHLFYEMGPDFKGFSAGAAWEDATFGLLHLSDFGHIAVVTDIEWIRLGAKMFAPLISSPVHVFHVAERDAALRWIEEAANKPEAKPGVEATHKIALLEDRLPPDP
ncbi:MAG: STAS/SEC14 domain-containing protein [Rhodobacteraceae bacterium]|nr:STAS/SEC14 domain-containing protein [Paracoccaceae bacterium]MCP5342532.1 STAS/SEC14 domain-containing protein [Paracoccaceae bacterium]